MDLIQWKNDQIEPHCNGKYDSGQQHNWLIPPVFTHYGRQNESISPLTEQTEQYPPKMSKNRGDKNFFLYIHIYIYGKILSFAHPPKWGDSLQRVCRQTILDIPSTFQRPCIRTVVQQIVYLWQCVTSGLCNHLRFPRICNDKPSSVSQDCAILRHLGFPMIVQW